LLAFAIQVVASGVAAWFAQRLYSVWLNAPESLARAIGMLVGSVVGVALARQACDTWLRPYNRFAVAWSFAIVMAVFFAATILSAESIAMAAGPLLAIIGTGVSAWLIFRRNNC
jgi:hypothetical protein